MDTLLVVLLIGATARLTRFITADAITEPLRSVFDRLNSERLSYMVRCDWCVSVWTGFGFSLLGWHAPVSWSMVIGVALTASLVTGWLATLEDAVLAKQQ